MNPPGERYPFRWARGFSLALLAAELGFVAGFAGIIFGAVAGESAWILLTAIPIGLAAAFVGVFALRLRSAHVTLFADHAQVYFPLSMDTEIPYAAIRSARVVNHIFIAGLGIRTNLSGHVALATAWGPSAELELQNPVRAGILPYIWWTHARTLRLTVERPESFVAAISAKLPSPGGDQT